METAATALVWVLVIGAALSIIALTVFYISIYKTKQKAEKYFGKKGEKIIEDLESAARKKLEELKGK
jgi:hypothetical protein